MLEEGPDPLGSLAAAELKVQTDVWRERVLAEASRLAAAQQEPIAPRDIKRAVLIVDGPPTAHEQPRPTAVSLIVSYVMTLLAGVFGANMDEAWGSILFGITFVLGVLALSRR